jgi:pyrimidine-specific ribonucleoside hydrolase
VLKTTLLLYLCAFGINFLYADHFSSKPMSLVVDTDMGDDDIMALISLLRKPNVLVKAITLSSTGLTHANEGLRNLRRLLYLLNRQEIPVASGRELPLQGGHQFPDSWRARCDILLDKIPSIDNAAIENAPSCNAVELLRNTIESSPEKTTILALGPLTNIAELFKLNPDLLKKVEKLHIMGGAVDVPGNLSVFPDNKVAEWNIFADPLAAKEVLKTGIPIYLIALNATNHVPLTQEFYDYVKNNYKTHLSILFFHLLTEVMPVIQMDGFYFWDVVAVETLVAPNLANFEPRTIDIVTTEGPQCGQTISCESGYSIQLATKIDRSQVLQAYFDTVNTE